MKQPYYIIHASLGYKDKSQYSYYLAGHAEDQHEYKQKKSMIARTFSHNSQMNATGSTPFYPKQKMMQAPVQPPMQTHYYKDMNKRKFSTSVSHGMLNNLGGMYAQSADQMNWNHMNYPAPEMIDNYSNVPSYGTGGQWSVSQNQMIPSALQSQSTTNMLNQNRKMGGMKGSMSTEFNYNFNSKAIGEHENKFGLGYFENDSDSDGEGGQHYFSHFSNKGNLGAFKPAGLNKNTREAEDKQ